MPREDLENAVAATKLAFIFRDEESQWVAVEDRRWGRVAFEKTAKRMLRHLEDSDNAKVGVTELQEQLAISEEAGTSIWQTAQQAMNGNGQKIFDIFNKAKKRCVLPVWPDGTRS